MGNKIASSYHDIPELTKMLSKSSTFQKTSLTFHDMQNFSLRKFHKELHNTAFPDDKIDEPKRLEDFNQFRDVENKK